MYGYFRCPDCKEDGTKMLVQFGEEVKSSEDVKVEFTCKTCNKKVQGEVIHIGEGKCYQVIHNHD